MLHIYSMKNLDLTTRISNIEKRLSEYKNELRIANNIKQESPDLSLTKSRIVLERLLHKIYRKQTNQSAEQSTLKQLLDHRLIRSSTPQRIYTRMHTVRKMANLGAHGHETTESDAVR